MIKKFSATLIAVVVAFGTIATNAAPAISAQPTSLASTALPVAKKVSKPKHTVAIKVSAKKPTIGSNVKLSATVKKNGKAVKGTAVSFYRIHSMDGSKKKLGTAKTNSKGVASFTRKVDIWDAAYSAASQKKSKSVEISPLAKVSWSLPKSKTVSRGSAPAFTASVKAFPFGSVTLESWDRSLNRWVDASGSLYPSKPVLDATAQGNHASFMLDAKGKASLKFWGFDVRGTYKFRLRFDGSQVHGVSYSTSSSIKVK